MVTIESPRHIIEVSISEKDKPTERHRVGIGAPVTTFFVYGERVLTIRELHHESLPSPIGDAEYPSPAADSVDLAVG
jgi:hypothetical protein